MLGSHRQYVTQRVKENNPVMHGRNYCWGNQQPLTPSGSTAINSEFALKHIWEKRMGEGWQICFQKLLDVLSFQTFWWSQRPETDKCNSFPQCLEKNPQEWENNSVESNIDIRSASALSLWKVREGRDEVNKAGLRQQPTDCAMFTFYFTFTCETPGQEL